DATPLKNGATASNGFTALSEFDGNHDGVIDARDPVWSQLLLWRDLNHDAISQPSEITPVAGSGVTAIEFTVRWSGRRDHWGNAFRYRSTVWIGERAHPTPRPLYDIIFTLVK